MSQGVREFESHTLRQIPGNQAPFGALCFFTHKQTHKRASDCSGRPVLDRKLDSLQLQPPQQTAGIP